MTPGWVESMHWHLPNTDSNETQNKLAPLSQSLHEAGELRKKGCWGARSVWTAFCFQPERQNRRWSIHSDYESLMGKGILGETQFLPLNQTQNSTDPYLHRLFRMSAFNLLSDKTQAPEVWVILYMHFATGVTDCHQIMTALFEANIVINFLPLHSADVDNEMCCYPE